jgi:uncharacterized membrane protein
MHSPLAADVSGDAGEVQSDLHENTAFEWLCRPICDTISGGDARPIYDAKGADPWRKVMNMRMDGTVLIRRPVDGVWDYVMDLGNDANWRTGVDESGLQSDRPLGPGVVGYTRAGDQQAEWRVTQYTAGESVDWEFLNGPFEGRGGYRLLPVQGGTQFTLVADVKPRGWMKLLGPLFGWIGQRQNQQDVERLRDILESAMEEGD